jgi:cell division transport system permease protein
VIAVRLADPGLPLDPVAAQLQEVAPGSLVEDESVWASRLAVLGRSLQACAAAALLVVAAVAAAVIAVATRGGLMARREAIEIVHGLGATDGYIAGRFAARATLLAASGGVIGGILALPALLAMAHLAAPFATASAAAQGGVLDALPVALWLLLPGLPLAAAIIGFCTAQGTVRRWLRRLP